MTPPPPQGNEGGNDEQAPLLQRNQSYYGTTQETQQEQEIDFSKEDSEDPKNWPRWRKLSNVALIALMTVLAPLASSMFTPAISQIGKDLNAGQQEVIGATTGYLVLQGIGPLVLAPLSETFGRRRLYIICFGIFALLQIPAALSPNLACLIACMTLSGFFGSVGISNGGGTISDMFYPSERAGVFGWYLLGPLLGPTLGPLFGGAVTQNLGWRWIFFILCILCMVNTLLGAFFLKESYRPVILSKRCAQYSKEYNGSYTFPGEDRRSLPLKLAHSMQRPLKILATQPIVLTMGSYQAVIYATIYSLYTNMEPIFANPPYNFTTMQVGLLYLAPGAGFLIAVWFIVPRIDTVFNKLTERNNGIQKPEYRLPLANIGAVLIPAVLFWFGWTVQKTHWAVSIIPTVFFGIGQVTIFNTVQNYYIDSFQKYAASAIAAGAVFRSLVGGIIPLLAPALFGELGYAWGWSVFAFVAILLAPSPLIFMKYGERIREKFWIEL